MMLFSSFGYDTRLQLPLLAAAAPVPWKWPGGHTTVNGARFADKTALCWMATTPAGCGHVVVAVVLGSGQLTALKVPPWLASGDPRVLNRIPAEPVLSLWAMVLLMMFTIGESCSEIAPPSQPATLLTTMLFVNVTVFHWPGSAGKVVMSVPLTLVNATPPPVPLSAVFPIIRLALTTSPGPTPSLGDMVATGLF